jgi:penicillin-binding protein 1A
MSDQKPLSELVKVFWISLGIILSGAIIVLLFIGFLSRDLPSLEQLENYDPDLVTRIYSIDGKSLDKNPINNNTIIAPDSMMPKEIQNTLTNSLNGF